MLEAVDYIVGTELVGRAFSAALYMYLLGCAILSKVMGLWDRHMYSIWRVCQTSPIPTNHKTIPYTDVLCEH